MKVAVFGFGAVGRVFAQQSVLAGASVTAIADSSGVLLPKSANGAFASNLLNEIATMKTQGSKGLMSIGNDGNLSISKHVAAVSVPQYLSKLQADRQSIAGLVLADCSAYADAAKNYLLPAQKLGVPIALANKKPLTQDLAAFRALTDDRNLIRFEATCGAGLPVIITLRRLFDAKDEVLSIQGCLSGTLGYIFSNLEHSKGAKFSDVVKQAHKKGFTEPDPRDDLSGVDVARKALIMCRMLGYQIDLKDIKVEKLYSDDMSKLSVKEFMENLPKLDDEFAKKLGATAARGMKTRYVATIKCIDEKRVEVKVGMDEVQGESVLGGLKGTDNCVVFQTRAYNENKLVVRGPGAGLDVTAQGVLADCFDIHGSRINKHFYRV